MQHEHPIHIFINKKQYEIHEPVFAELAIEDELIAPSLRHLRRCSQFIQKQDALAVKWKDFRRNPFRAVRSDSWQAAQIDRVELHRPDVEELAIPVGGDLGDNLRLADTAGAPDVQGHTFVDQRMKRLVEF